MAFRKRKKTGDIAETAEPAQSQSDNSDLVSYDLETANFRKEFDEVWGKDAVQHDNEDDGKVRYNLSRREIADSPQPNICFTLDSDASLILSYGDCITREIDETESTLTLAFSTGHIITCEGEGLKCLREALQQNRVKHLYRFKPQLHVLEAEAKGAYISKVIVGEE